MLATTKYSHLALTAIGIYRDFAWYDLIRMAKFYYFCGSEQFQPEVLVRQAKLAEEVGFDGVMVSEHFHPWVDDVGAAGFMWSLLGAMAVVTKKVELMTGVVTPLFRYHPAVVAQAAATVDRLSGGRFLLGVGTGENINEGPLGYEFPNYAERAERMREALEIMRRLMDGEKLSFKGKFYQTDRAKLYSPPVGKVPILMAAGGPKSAELVGEMADGVIVSVKKVMEAKEIIKISNIKYQKSNKIVVATRWSVYAKDDDEAWEALKPWRGLRAPGRLEAVDPVELRKRADEMDRSEILDSYSIVSTVDEYVEVYKPLMTDLGADVVVVQSMGIDQEKVIKLLGEKVLPKLRTLV